MQALRAVPALYTPVLMRLLGKMKLAEGEDADAFWAELSEIVIGKFQVSGDLDLSQKEACGRLLGTLRGLRPAFKRGISSPALVDFLCTSVLARLHSVHPDLIIPLTQQIVDLLLLPAISKQHAEAHFADIFEVTMGFLSPSSSDTKSLRFSLVEALLFALHALGNQASSGVLRRVAGSLVISGQPSDFDDMESRMEKWKAFQDKVTPAVKLVKDAVVVLEKSLEDARKTQGPKLKSKLQSIMSTLSQRRNILRMLLLLQGKKSTGGSAASFQSAAELKASSIIPSWLQEAKALASAGAKKAASNALLDTRPLKRGKVGPSQAGPSRGGKQKFVTSVRGRGANSEAVNRGGNSGGVRGRGGGSGAWRGGTAASSSNARNKNTSNRGAGGNSVRGSPGGGAARRRQSQNQAPATRGGRGGRGGFGGRGRRGGRGGGNQR